MTRIITISKYFQFPQSLIRLLRRDSGNKHESNHDDGGSKHSTRSDNGGGNDGDDGDGCDDSYPDFCIRSPPPDLDCGGMSHKNFKVVGSDPHRLDGDNDGKGCESADSDNGGGNDGDDGDGCDDSYPDFCIRSPPPDWNAAIGIT